VTGPITDEALASIYDSERRRLVDAVDVRSIVAAAMRSGVHTFGTILFARTGKDATFENFEVIVAEEIGRRAAGAIERSRLYTSEHQQRERLEHLQTLTEALATALTTADACDAIIREMRELVGAKVIVIGLVSDDGARMNVLRTAGVPEEVAQQYPYIQLGEQLPLTSVIRTGEAIWLRTREEAVRQSSVFREIASGSNAWAAIPLIVTGRSIGALGLSFEKEQVFPEEDRAFILSMARQTAQALERARLFDSERAAREEAEKASRAKDEFLAILSHELRTPLTTVLGWADLLKMTYSGPEESIRFAIQSLRASAATQARLIDDLLDVSRIVTGKLNIEKRPSELTEIVRVATESLRLSAETKGVALEVDALCCIDIDADPARLNQIITNLVTNAIKFTPAGGRVHVSVRRHGKSAEVVVRDTGIGISPDFLPHVFERFRQGSMGDSRSHSGLGLGLSIVQHLVNLHGGRVRAESDGPGKGATFTVTLPVREE
jgi:signal transduction histidine kinase